MKQKIFTQYEGIKTQDLQTMLDAMNRYMRQHSNESPQGRWEMMGDSFVGVVEYTVSERVPETELEEFEEKHGRHRCWECPLLDVSEDKRRKSYPCMKGGTSRTDSPCCEYFYQQIEAGKIKVGD